MAVKIDLISGFLGAGKTTLIKKFLNEAFQNEKVAVIENEFGQIGIDGTVLRGQSIPVREISAGCICCSLQGDFRDAIRELLKSYRPDRIIIEPSGVGKLSDILRTCRLPEIRCDAEINMVIAVADASRMEMYLKNFGEFYMDQLRHAGIVVLSRTQNLPAERMDHVCHKVRNINPTATVVTTPWDMLSAQVILAAAQGADTLRQELEELRSEVGEDSCIHEHHSGHSHEHDHEHGHGHDADDMFESWGIETARSCPEEEVREILRKLDGGEYGEILRGKGILHAEGDSWMQFDLVPGEARVQPAQPGVTGRVCIIGRALEEKKLGRLFHTEQEPAE